MRRLLVAACVALLTLLAVEGALSLLAGRSLRAALGLGDGAGDGADAPLVPGASGRRPGDEERAATAAGTPGLHRAHPDPRVGYTLKVSAQLTMLEAPVTTDALGMRIRPGAPPPADAQRIVVLGDSVAFGLGLKDDETLACRLEAALAAVRGPGAPPVAAYTVAAPGWNVRNAACFLLDHLDVIDPHLVVFVAVPNDLVNTWGVTEAGHLREAPDVATPHPWMPVHVEVGLERLLALSEAAKARGEPRPALDSIGPSVLEAGLTRESAWRYEDAAAQLVRLAERLRRRAPEGRRVVLCGGNDAFSVRLLAHLPFADFPFVPLLAEYRPEDTLGFNPHPNAATTTVMATWIAQTLLEQGLVGRGEGRPLPAVPAALAARRASAPTAAELAAAHDAHRREALDALMPEIDADTGRGLRQVYAGASAGMLVGPELLAVLPRRGARLEVTLSPLAERPDLYPLALQVEIDGVAVGAITLEAGVVTASFPVPAGDADRPLEIGLRAPDWVVLVERGRSVLAAARLQSLRVID